MTGRTYLLIIPIILIMLAPSCRGTAEGSPDGGLIADTARALSDLEASSDPKVPTDWRVDQTRIQDNGMTVRHERREGVDIFTRTMDGSDHELISTWSPEGIWHYSFGGKAVLWEGGFILEEEDPVLASRLAIFEDAGFGGDASDLSILDITYRLYSDGTRIDTRTERIMESARDTVVRRLTVKDGEDTVIDIEVDSVDCPDGKEFISVRIGDIVLSDTAALSRLSGDILMLTGAMDSMEYAPWESSPRE